MEARKKGEGETTHGGLGSFFWKRGCGYSNALWRGQGGKSMYMDICKADVDIHGYKLILYPVAGM